MVRETPSISEVPEKKTRLGRWLQKVFERKPDSQDAREYRETRENTKKNLASLQEGVGLSQREKIDALRKQVLATSDIAHDKAATLAYQNLILLTDPGRFHKEIGIADGIFGPLTRAAYERDIAILNEPRQNWLQRLFGRKSTPKPEEKTRSKGEIRAGAGSIQSAPYEINPETKVTLCSQTAAKNLTKLLGNEPIRGNAHTVFQKYLQGSSGPGMINFSKGAFNPPTGANVADILLDTPELPQYDGNDYGHRASAYKEGGKWYVLDPYYGGKQTRPIELTSYLKAFQRPELGYSIRGIGFYQSGQLDNLIAQNSTKNSPKKALA